MLATVYTCTLVGLDARLVTVEVDISNGLPAFDIVGLPDTAIREARDRVRAAIKNSGLEFPLRRVTVNLAPADLPKEGSGFDLPIALGILAATGQLESRGLSGLLAMGELALDGSIRGINGVLSRALGAASLIPGCTLLVPGENGSEASLVSTVRVSVADSLRQLASRMTTDNDLEIYTPQALPLHLPESSLDLGEVLGQEGAKRALEVTAAGGHNLLFIGTPGGGKTMLSQRLPSIMPSMSRVESLEATKIHSVAGMLDRDKPLVQERPFRAPHHTASTASIVGGGRPPRPGEITLATHGVLFMDEFPEFSREVLEALRQPLENHQVTITRIGTSVTFPADFLLLASMNPCPCGNLGDPEKACRCTPLQVDRYWHRLSGPLMDRIDLQVEVPRLAYSQVEKPVPREDSATVRQRVMVARERQEYRLKNEGRDSGQNVLPGNSRLTPRQVREYCRLGNDARLLMRQAFNRLGLSMRAHDRILKVARTIADLDGSEDIGSAHLAEALQFRTMQYRQV